MFRNTNQDPIEVVVQDGRYNCYGEVTPRSLFLFKTLQAQGGISDTVADGVYHYNVIRKGFKLVATLEPIK